MFIFWEVFSGSNVVNFLSSFLLVTSARILFPFFSFTFTNSFLLTWLEQCWSFFEVLGFFTNLSLKFCSEIQELTKSFFFSCSTLVNFFLCKARIFRFLGNLSSSSLSDIVLNKLACCNRSFLNCVIEIYFVTQSYGCNTKKKFRKKMKGKLTRN